MTLEDQIVQSALAVLTSGTPISSAPRLAARRPVAQTASVLPLPSHRLSLESGATPVSRPSSLREVWI